ncbi:RagB/SusD family nutrient uptake outer membrane protein [Flavobacterium panici]|uniref:RagB/SusD family nutrient uptake outer membrane protein n=1 Tax=Flavobacterium panici TaxID=2654843 RepID=A0A9N8J1B6_9FLAO|nr:RagB/SusD family nutrient uptake outer membrane protein [Flavobacterium panici]CAC9974409.1 RagB/SusD family nutrient uptake outer membrane protein [Flavobacterium panici]
MKTIHNLLAQLLLFMLLGLLFSCDSFVEVDLPKSQLTAEAVFEDYNTANAAMTNIYSTVRDKGILCGAPLGISNQLGNYADELVTIENPAKQGYTFYHNSLLPSSTYVSGYWNAAYNQIYAANNIIQGSQASKNLTLQQKNQLIGQSLFIRALMHFYLANIFGDIPYVAQTDYKMNSTLSRTSIKDVYKAVILDLQNAIPLLSPDYLSEERTLPNAAAAQALLARVFLYDGAYPQASNAASAVLNQTSLYGLESSTNVFLIHSKETIWQLQSELEGQNTADGSYFIFTSVPPPSLSLNNNLVASFAPADLRRVNWIKAVSKGAATYYHAFKYHEKNFTPASKEYAVVFRTAELYLIRAEARAMQGDLIGAKEDLNKIRNRSGLGNTQAAGRQEILDAVLTERRWEYFSEYGHRFFDLKRFGKLDAVLSTVKPGWDTADRLFPLPQAELAVNPNLRPQNPGY